MLTGPLLLVHEVPRNTDAIKVACDTLWFSCQTACPEMKSMLLWPLEFECGADRVFSDLHTKLAHLIYGLSRHI